MNIKSSRRLGSTQIDLPILGLGCAPIGELFDRLSAAKAQTVLESAWDAGIRYFDTSPFYGFGRSEHRLGHFLQEMERNTYSLSTKVGRVFRRFDGEPAAVATDSWTHPLPFTFRCDYGYDGIMRSYEDSTQRMGISQIDILLVHDLDYWALETEDRVAEKLKELESGWKALDSLRRSGEVKAIGVGINEEVMVPRFLENFDPDCLLVAQPYTLLDQDTLDNAFPQCAERGISVIIGAPYASGILATGPIPRAKYRYGDAPPEILQRVSRIIEVGKRHGVSLSAAAVQFPLAHPVVVSVIPGAREPEHVHGTIAAMETTIPDDFWREMKENRLIREDAPVPSA